MKILIFDSSTLISFAMNGLYEELEKLKKIFPGKFIITEDIKKEVIDRPLSIKRFELEALQIKKLLDNKILEMPEAIDIKNNELISETRKVMDFANNCFKTNNKTIHLIDYGEASCLALARLLNQRKIENAVVVDERTARMLGEKPQNLLKLMSEKLHTKVMPNSGNYNFFKGLRFIRSSELIYVAYKKGLIDLKNGQVLDALLWAMKFKGCAISGDEIKEIERIG